MLKSFFVITLRVLWRNKVTSLVNIFSLSIGITAFLFIMLYVQNETAYDKFNKNYNNIYRLQADAFARLPPTVGPHVMDRIPEVKCMTRLVTMEEIDIMYKPDGNPQNIKHVQTNLLWADSTTFDIFTLPFVQGDARSALMKPFTCVLTESVAHELFDEGNAVGKSIILFDHTFEITAIINDVRESHFDVKALVSHSSIPKVFAGRDLNNTGRNSWLWSATYFRIDDQIDVGSIEKKINSVLAEINDGKLFDTKFTEFELVPLRDIYFEKPLQNLDYGFHGSFNLVSILFTIGVFMLSLAAINYVNLTTARSTVRTKEVAMKRVVGSSIALVRFQLILESILITLAALVVALTFTLIFIGPFNAVTMSNIQISELNRPEVWISILFGVTILGIAAGIYPAIYLTAAKPVKLITTSPDNYIASRSILMTFQFTLSIILMVCALAILRQLEYMRNADLGFYKEQIVQIDTPYDIPEEFSLRETFKNNLLQISEIAGVTYSAGSQAGSIRVHPIESDGKKYTLEFFLVDHDFFKVMNIEVLEGKGFSPKTLLDMPTLMLDKFSILLNESAVRELGLKSPVGKILYWEDQGVRRSYEVLGVVKDFHFRSLHHRISPLMMIQTPPMLTASIKINSARIPATMKSIQQVWKKVYGDKLLTYKFLDEKFNDQYKTDEQLATVIFWFTGLAMVIACLGLFALSSFMITRRTKEIGIRKSMGASVRSIYFMLSWDFLKWVVAAIIIGCPIAGYLMNLWLSGFAYHITLESNIFILASSLAMGIALLTVTWHALKAANANPIKALRYE